MSDEDFDTVPHGQGQMPMCPDCFCPPHRNVTKPKGNKECPRCGCPDFFEAKRDRDGERLSDHYAGSERNANPGFGVDGPSYGTSIGQ